MKDLIINAEDLSKKVKEASEENKEIQETLDSTSQVINSIMDGRQIDLAFFKAVAAENIKRFKKKKGK